MSTLKELEKLFTQGKITRREFIARVSALGLMAAVSPALLGTSAEAAGTRFGRRLDHRFHGPGYVDGHNGPDGQSMSPQPSG
jgi:hypothetical protein